MNGSTYQGPEEGFEQLVLATYTPLSGGCEVDRAAGFYAVAHLNAYGPEGWLTAMAAVQTGMRSKLAA